MNYPDRFTACVCETCGASFERKTTDVRRGKAGRFCTKTCSNLARTYRRRDPVDRFWAKVTKDGPVARSGLTPCWLWTGYVAPSGYGHTSVSHVQGDNEYSHRFSYALHNGPIPGNKLVLHECDMRSCVNPEHLYLGDHAQNTADMDCRGRRAQGPALKPATVRAIRLRFAEGASLQQVSREFGVSDSFACLIRQRKRWGKVG